MSLALEPTSRAGADESDDDELAATDECATAALAGLAIPGGAGSQVLPRDR